MISCAVLDAAREKVEVRRFPNPAGGLYGPTERDILTTA